MPDQSTLSRSNRPINPSTGPLLPRLGNAILLRREFYDAVAADARATGPAGAIVCIAALARESIGLYQMSQDFKAWGLVLLLVVIFAIFRWLLYTTIMYPLARALSGQPVPYKRLLRCLGFAETPAVLSLAGFLVPDQFFPWVQFGVGAWLLLATIVAVRSATATTLQRAAAIGVVGFVAYLGLGLAIDVATRVAPDESAPPPALTLRGSLWNSLRSAAHATPGDRSMADAPQSTEQKTERPIVPFLALGDQPHLMGLRCTTCGATYLKSGRIACSKCGGASTFEEVRLSDRGTLWVYSIVHQSAPGIPVPYVAAIVDLPENVSVRCTLVDVTPDPAKLPFGMPVKMITKKVRTDKEGRDVIAFFFRPDTGHA